MLIVIVSILSGHLAKSRITLHTYKIFKSIHTPCHANTCRPSPFTVRHRLRINLKHRLIGIFQFPNQNQPYQNRITNLIIHLYRLHIQITGAKRQLFLVHERVYPKEACVFKSAFIFTEKHHHTCLIRFLRKISRKHQHKQQYQHKQNRNR